MIETSILAEIAGKWDFSGILCLAAIPCLLIVLVAYSKGIIAGSSTCFILFWVFVFGTADSSTMQDIPGSHFNAPRGFITNESQTKWLLRDPHELEQPNSVFIDDTKGTHTLLDDEWLFIPGKEIMIVDGEKRMKPDGREIDNDDYYHWDKIISKNNVSTEHGGDGVPQWLYHPAAPNYIFGVGALPIMGLGALIASKM